MAIRLMLADDHRLLRDGLRRSLTEEGFDVIGEASDGHEAIDLADRLRPDVVLMDVTMPGCDGVEATRRISAAHPEIRVVMLTMHADQDVLRSALAAGASGYLIKDCSVDEISETIRMACDEQHALSPGLAASMLDEVRRLDEPSTASPDRVVTKREEEVLQLIADGCSTSEVAERLYISQKTVKNHLASIYQKLDARDRTQAVLQAVRMGIVRLG
jgi:DNA-binding NarL/FixJ family response regulator